MVVFPFSERKEMAVTRFLMDIFLVIAKDIYTHVSLDYKIYRHDPLCMQQEHSPSISLCKENRVQSHPSRRHSKTSIAIAYVIYYSTKGGRGMIQSKRGDYKCKLIFDKTKSKYKSIVKKITK